MEVIGIEQMCEYMQHYQVLLKKYQMSHNRARDGVEDMAEDKVSARR